VLEWGAEKFFWEGGGGRRGSATSSGRGKGGKSGTHILCSRSGTLYICRRQYHREKEVRPYIKVTPEGLGVRERDYERM